MEVIDHSALFVGLLGLAVTLPTALILPFLLHSLKVLQQLEHRLDKIERVARCPYQQ